MRSYWQQPKKYDVVINGGGITGLSLAYWINQIRPSALVAIYEKNYVGAGASGKNAGFLTCGSLTYFNQLMEKFGLEKSLEIWKFHQKNHELLLPFLAGCDYEKKGAMSLSSSPEHTQKLQAAADVLNSNGFSIKEKNLLGFDKAFLYEGDGSVNPIKLLESIKKSLKVDFYFGEQKVEGSLVIEATNGYSKDLPLPCVLTPQRAQVLMLASSPRFIESTCYHYESLTYFKQLPTGEFLIGGARTLDSKTEQTQDVGLNPKIQSYLESFIRDNFSSLKDLPIIHQWAGIMAFTEDHLPIAGKIDHRRYFIGGYSGHGMGMAFNSSKHLVEYLFLKKPLPWFLDMRRFTGDDGEEFFVSDEG